MSNYDTARALLDEIYASVPSDEFKHQCLELIHPAFNVPDMPPGRIRLVNHQFTPLIVTLENGDEAAFQPGAFIIKFPAKSTNGRRDIQLTLDAVSAENIRQLERVADHAERVRITAVVREYAESHLEYPGRIDGRLTVINPTVSGSKVQCSLVFNDTLNKTIPSILYKLDTHPGLAT